MGEFDKYEQDPNTSGYKSDGGKIKVLIVDDSLAHRRMLRKLLEDVGYNVAGEAEDGKGSIMLYSQMEPDVVTMDVTMPEMDGDDAVNAIIKKHPDAKIVMVTSLGHKELVQDCIKHGAKGYILKPITSAQVPKILETIKKAAIGG